VARGSALSSTGAAVRGTWPAGAAAARQTEEQRRKREGRRRGTEMEILKNTRTPL
jgi:hypothetical protein